jgi:predicted Fe-Mo cluster-binding NifX family protein
MNIAMTVWGERISPVLDSSRTLLVAELERGEILSRKHEPFAADYLMQMMQVLRRQGVRVLICGAVSQGPARIIEACGIELMPFLAGDVEEILAALARGQSVAAFAMPGCRCYGRCRMSQHGVFRRKTEKPG